MNAIIRETKTINGIIRIGGSKNAALPIIATSILTKEKVILKNVPNISDIDDLINILRKINVTVLRYDDKLIIQREKKIKNTILMDEVKKIRGSIYLLPAILLLRKKVLSKYPGGCNFGKRPIDYHLMAFKEMNVKIIDTESRIKLKTKKVKKANITFPKKTLGGTINTIVLAMFSKGETIINNPSFEPEVLDTISFLNSMGGNIRVLHDKIIIKGVRKLTGTTYKIMSDRIEASSYLFLATTIKQSNITICNVDHKLLKNELAILEKCGLQIKKSYQKITVINKDDYKEDSIKIIAGNYPAISTDLQQVITPLLFNLKKESIVIDTIYKDRTKHVNELKKLNGKLEIIPGKNLIIKVSPSNLVGTDINGVDLRGTFGLILAAGIAKGTTRIIGIDNVLRGYEDVINKLQKIGFKISIE